jgi:hypothetical protein
MLVSVPSFLSFYPHVFDTLGVRAHDALDVLQSRLELETDETQAHLRTLFGQRRDGLPEPTTDADLVSVMVELMAHHLPVDVVEHTTQRVCLCFHRCSTLLTPWL